MNEERVGVNIKQMDTQEITTDTPDESLIYRRFRTSSDFILREIGDESILVPVGDNEIFANSMISLNDTFLFLWKVFEEGASVDEALTAVRENYEGPAEEVRKNVIGFVRELLHYHMLEEE